MSTIGRRVEMLELADPPPVTRAPGELFEDFSHRMGIAVAGGQSPAPWLMSMSNTELRRLRGAIVASSHPQAPEPPSGELEAAP